MNNKPWPQQPHFLRILFLGVFLTNLLFGAIGAPVVGAAGDRVTSADGTSSPANSLRGSWQNPTNQLNALAAAQAVSKTTALQTEQLKNKARDLYNNSNLRFEPNQGQVSDSAVKFVARGNGYNFYLGADEFNFALVKSDKTSQAQNNRQASSSGAAPGEGPNATSGLLTSTLASAKLSPKMRQAQNLLTNQTLQAKTTSNSSTQEQQPTNSNAPGLVGLQMKLVGGNVTASAKSEEPLKITNSYNYQPISSVQTATTTPARANIKNVPSYGQIHYSEIYPGIDLTFYSNSARNLEYDFVVTPGADPNNIKLQFKGADKLELNDNGALVIHIGDEQLVSSAPIVYQPDNKGNRRDVSGSYLLLDGQQVGFKLGNYDPKLPVIIDPTIIFATYFNGSDYDAINAVTTDKDGNIFAAGTSLSVDLGQNVAGLGVIASNLQANRFVTKINADFSSIAFLYFGVTGNDTASTIAVADSGNIFVGGFSYNSSGTPVGYFAKFDSDLNASLQSVIGNHDTLVEGIAADPTGRYVYLAGWTRDHGLPVGLPSGSTVLNTFPDALNFSDNQDASAFVAKIDTNSNTAVYCFYLSGNTLEQAFDLKVDSDGNVYVIGETWSSNFPVTGSATAPLQATQPSGNSGFLTVIEADAKSILYSTYLGGEGNVYPESLSLDNNHRAYIGGFMYHFAGAVQGDSSTFPLKRAFQPTLSDGIKGFLTVVDFTPNVTHTYDNRLVYSTLLGSNNSGSDNEVWGVATNGSGSVFLTGYTSSISTTTTPRDQSFPLRNQLPVDPGHTNSGKVGDAFFAHLNTNASGDASLTDSTYLGGSGEDFGAAIAVDPANNIYVVGFTYSSDFPFATGYNPGSTNYGACENDQSFVEKHPYSTPSDAPSDQNCHQQDGFFVKLSLAQTLPLGGCDGGAIRATQFVPLGYGSEQLNCQEVDPNDGNYAASVTDLSLTPPLEVGDLAINFGRHYNSQDPIGGILGAGWRYSYEWSLENVDDVVTITTPTGRKDVFPFLTYGVRDGFFGYVTAYGDGSLVKINDSYQLTTLDKAVYEFKGGKLDNIVDRNNHQLKFTYDTTSGILSKIELCLVAGCTSPVQSLTVNKTTAADGSTLLTVSVGGLTPTRSVVYTTKDGVLTNVKDVRLNNTGYTYYTDADHLNMLHTVTDPLTHGLISLTYDTQKRVSTAVTQLNGDKLTSFDYSTPGRTVVTNPRGAHSTYFYKGGQSASDPRRTTQVIDAEGYSHTFDYDTHFNLSSVTDDNHHTTYYTYNPKGLVETVAHDVNGVARAYKTTTYYNDKNQISSVVDSRNNTTSIEYDSGHNNPKVVKDTLNNTVTYEYYPGTGNRIKTVTTASNGTNKLVVNYLYDSNGFPSQMQRSFPTLVGTATTPSNVTIFVDYTYNAADGRLTTQSDPYSDGTPKTVSYSYDEAGHVLQTKNQLNETAINHYDPAGNLDTSTSYLGQVTNIVYNDANLPTDVTRQVGSGGLTTHNDYDELGNVKQFKDPKGVITTYVYDNLHRQTSMSVDLAAGGQAKTTTEYDGAGNVKKVTRFNSPANEVITYDYDELDRLTTTTAGVGPFNYVSKTVYDLAGNVLEVDRSHVGAGTDSTPVIVYSASSYDALNRPASTTVYPGTGAPLITSYTYIDADNTYSVTDPDGIQTIYQSDYADRLIKVTVNPAAGGVSGANPQTSYMAYDAVGNLLHMADPSNNWVNKTYDALHRLHITTAYTQPGGGGTALSTQIDYVDQPKPQVTTTGPAHTGGSYKQTLSYDEAGRLTSSDDTITTLSYEYDGQGNVTKLTDPLKVTRYTYENTGWLTQVDQDLTVPSAQTISTLYTYDQVGNRLSTKTKDTSDHVTTATYDVLNRLVTTQDGLGTLTRRSYNGLDQLIAYTDGKGQTTSYVYDNISRLLSVSSAGGLVTSYDYTNNQLTAMHDSNPTTDTQYKYDGLDRLREVDSPQGIVKYGYDDSNRRTQLQFGSRSVSYGYDALNRLTSVTGWANTATYGYDGELLHSLSYPNGVAAAFTYDTANRLTDLKYTQSNNATLYSAHYDLNSLGNPLKLTESVNGTNRVSNYTYDSLSRLINESNLVGSSGTPLKNVYTYDNAGNRTQLVADQSNNTTVTTNNYYDKADRLITTTAKASNARTGSTTVYGYDGNNSLVRETYTGPAGSGGYVTQYGYDSRNRLTSVQKQQTGSTVVALSSFSYDGNDTRLSQTANGQTTSYLQDAADGLPVVLQETSNNQATSYIYTPGSTSPLMQTDPANNSTWYQPDAQGSVRLMTDGNGGTVRASYIYNAFGQTIGQTQSGTISNTHYYAGEQLDSTGLYYNRARYYNPASGRFIQQDSYGGTDSSPVSQNRYIYANDDPTSGTDPSGHDFWSNLTKTEAYYGTGLVRSTLNVFTQLGGIGLLALNGFDQNKTADELTSWSRQQPVVAWAVTNAQQLGYWQAVDTVSSWTNMIPVVGEIKMVRDGLAGHDLFSGRELSSFERASDILSGGLGLFARGFGAMAEARAGAAAEGSAAGAAESVGCNSFVAGTSVQSENGTVPIESLKVGDKVWAQDPQTGESGYYPITFTTNHTASDLVQVLVGPAPASANQSDSSAEVLRASVIAGASTLGSASGSSSGASPGSTSAADETNKKAAELIEATPEHPFWVVGKGWVNASELVAGDRLISQDGTTVAVLSTVAVKREAQVYNFTVDQLHTYFVGKEGLLVHNTGGDSCIIYRYGTMSRADTFDSRLLLNKDISDDVKEETFNRLKNDPLYLAAMIEKFANGHYEYGEEPFIALTTNPHGALETDDNWLRGIINEGAEHLITFEVPRAGLLTATGHTSGVESEFLWLRGGLRAYYKTHEINPYIGQVRQKPFMHLRIDEP